ncbi:radical SAM protein [Clostridioides difficile]|uniref:radical SAM/SPASM domain-containing protein n=1 Tax=Clostridioides difficile TaxID=1496 RepID=UPI00254AF5A3|nr:radical SAM protein [Clostridioides difficile]MDL0416725.1 radical SAM protein [Clostridioides difficile]
MNYLNKYYVKDLANISIDKKEVYISAKFKPEWFKFPKICLDILDYSFDKQITVGELLELFNDENDKIYFKKILSNLDKIGILMSKPISNVYVSRLNKVTFAITNKCNLKCSFCSQNSKIDNQEELSFEEIKVIIDKAMIFNPLKIVLTGGEPMIRNDFFDIVDYIKSNYQVDIQLCTNGTLIDNFNINKFKNSINAVDLSLDGFDEPSCSSDRGKGVYEKVVNSIDLLKIIGIHNISASMVVGNHNIDIVDKFVSFCNSKSIIPIKREFMSIGRGKEAIKYLKDEKDSMFYPDYNKIDKKIGARTCSTGITQLYIDHKGDIYPCSLLDSDEYKICSAMDLDNNIVDKVYKKEMDVYKKLAELSPLNYHKCEGCKYKLFCNNCIANMKIMIESDKEFEHNCQKLKNIYEKCLN